jgi:hypothetical protein
MAAGGLSCSVARTTLGPLGGLPGTGILLVGSRTRESRLRECGTNRHDGFAAVANIVPSAIGIPKSTGLSPDEYAAEVEQAPQLIQRMS